MNYRKSAIAAACLAALFAGGCSNRIGGNAPTDQSFGDAVRAAQSRQTLNPMASQNPTPAVLDGQAAKATVDRYEKSFELPPPPVNVYTIGVGTGTGGSSGAVGR
jgi:hypothetical protein